MSSDRTQHQSTDEIRKARELSLEPTLPPAQVPGYRLLKFIGRGAYGEVWSAQDLKTGRKVAIKFYTRRSSADVQLLAREIEKLVVLSADRYVVQLLDVGWEADPPYYVMDYIEHGSLEDRLKRQGPLTANEAIELFQELATGMMHLHDKGVLHCDLKPGNVLLDQDGKPRVADFGQSRLSTDETPALGTLFYMAPEQADLKAAPDASWDVYGLGALFFSMLTGKPPYFRAELATEIESSGSIEPRLETYRKALLAARKPTEHRSVPGVDRALAEIIDRCIAANPTHRFSNIQSLMLALGQRQLTRARMPLMVLGLLGPLMLVGVMTLFGWWAFEKSVDRTRTEITKKANESNQFAAQLAARSAAEQIDEYFRVVGQLTRDESFRQSFQDVISNPDLLQMRQALSHPNQNSSSDAEIITMRERFRNHPVRKQLQPFLEKRLFDAQGDFPIAAGWLVNDRWGNQIASAFRGENQTLGKNYSYRTYFTGLDKDLKTLSSATVGKNSQEIYSVSEDVEKRQVISRPHLSAVFISDQSNTWKVAFSSPLIFDGEVAGIVVISVDLGSFIEFENFKTHYAMMVDTRPGENPGIILEHPLFQEALSEHGKLPIELARVQVNVDEISSKDRFLDPVGKTQIGIEAGYDRESIVADERVMMEPPPISNLKSKTDMLPKRSDTGLRVLAVEDYETIVAPANDLRVELGRLALLASLFLLTVTVGMWFFVRRMLQESRHRLERTFSPSTESSPGDNLETLATHTRRTQEY